MITAPSHHVDPSPRTMTAPSLEHGHSLSDGLDGQPRLFRKHKVLPHPKRDQPPLQGRRTRPLPPRILDGAPRPGRFNLSIPFHGPTHTLKHESRRIPSGTPPQVYPDPPPTPPSQSRTSSSSHSVLPSSPTYVESPAQSRDDDPERAPATPPNQKSPPTPDVTPPQPANRPRAVGPRPFLAERAGSKSTTGSRTESFTTAREDPYMSEEDPDHFGTRPALPSERTSQSTVRRQPNGGERTPRLHPVGLGLGLEDTPDRTSTPRCEEFGAFDGGWRSDSTTSEVVQEWDSNLGRNVTVRKRQRESEAETRRAKGARKEVVEDDFVTPTRATEAVRGRELHGVTTVFSSPLPILDKDITESPTASTLSTEVRRFSGNSTKSTVSTVIEAVLVDGPLPQRTKTLRHMKKRETLRGSSSNVSRVSSGATSSGGLEHFRRQNPARRPADGRIDSYASTSSVHSVASAKARREVLKQGGIPVVIVPGRTSSVRSKEPSLRSASSRRSKRSMSLNSASLLNGSKSKDLTSYFEQPNRNSRVMSESGSDQRTIDYPPVIPKRRSSLSAGASKNSRSNSLSNSRTGSLTAESLRAHNALLATQALPTETLAECQAELQASPLEVTINEDMTGEKVAETNIPNIANKDDTHGVEDGTVVEPDRMPGRETPILQREHSFDEGDDSHHRLSVDRHGDPLFGRRLSSQNTPFSQFSMASTGTAPELSEALAVNLYPHQNTSVLMVDHGSSKPSEGSELSQLVQPTTEHAHDTECERPTIKTTAPDGQEPSTPPQPQHSIDGLDYSPLRNPRDAPEPPGGPPAIKFIPATPSGLTPWPEKQIHQGNYFEEMAEKPERRPSLVRRALSRRRHSVHGSPGELAQPGPPPARLSNLFSRALSLSRASRKTVGTAPAPNKGKETAYPSPEQPPAEEHKLHPFWRPAYPDHEDDGRGCGPECPHEGEPEAVVYRYPPIDNRPRRNFSRRMKQTFAILPSNDPEDELYHADERRTIRRTQSGNLRVMAHRASMESLGESSFAVRQQPGADRPCTAPERRDRSFWRSHSLRRDRSHARPKNDAQMAETDNKGFLPTINNTIGELGSLSRRFSERRREKRSEMLRQKISGPREVRDGVGDVIRRRSFTGFHEQQRQQEPHV
jgi:hypothetical protein